MSLYFDYPPLLTPDVVLTVVWLSLGSTALLYLLGRYWMHKK